MSLFLFQLLIAPLTNAADVSTLAGTWNVTAVSMGVGTCDNKTERGTTSAYVWIISTKPDGTVDISVQGETSFPKLSGTLVKDALTVTGYSTFESKGTFSLGSQTWFALTVDADGTMTGLRQYLGFKLVSLKSGGNGFAPCFVSSQVKARR